MYINSKTLIFIALVIIGFFIYVGFRGKSSEPIETQGIALGVQEETRPPKKQKVVGIQAGHWKNQELPDELANLRYFGGGSVVGNITEWEVNLGVAKKIAKILEKYDIKVDIMPATIPKGYLADAFVSIHTDGNDDTTVSGYKVGASSFDKSGKAKTLSEFISDEYEIATKMEFDPNITEDMTEFYGFNFVKFHSSISPMTPGAIIEVGFLTNIKDRKMMVNNQDVVAEGIANGILDFLGLKK